MTLIRSTFLAFKSGSSDKVYNVYLQELSAGEFRVFANYGRNGSTLREEEKLTRASLAQATAVFEALVNEKKTKKGYWEVSSSSVSPTTGTTSSTSSTAGSSKKTYLEHAVQLLNPVEKDEAQALLDDVDYFMQEKKDGERQMLSVTESGEIILTNRLTNIISSTDQLSKAAKALFKKTGKAFTLDGERIGDEFHVFDVLVYNGVDMRMMDALSRLTCLEQLGAQFNDEGVLEKTFRAVKGCVSARSKRQTYERLLKANAEGVVFKRCDAVYEPGRPASGGTQLKFKFVETATLRVKEQNVGKRSVCLELMDGADGWIEVGNVTVPANQDIPESGELVEVRYLYAYKGGSLFQPVLLGKRTDVTEDSCTTAQLKYKAEPATPAKLAAGSAA